MGRQVTVNLLKKAMQQAGWARGKFLIDGHWPAFSAAEDGDFDRLCATLPIFFSIFSNLFVLHYYYRNLN